MLSRFARSFFAITVALFILSTLAFFHPPSRAYIDPWTGEFFGEGGVEHDVHILPYPHFTTTLHLPQSTAAASGAQVGGPIMSQLRNETVKAELGRATWKLLYVLFLGISKPTQEEREALESYMYLTSRLYPCGECAAEFQELLKKFPPQTSSRLAASLWLCSVHNEVNTRLEKPTQYDCGCGGDDAALPTSTNAVPYSQSTSSGSGSGSDDLERDTGRDDVTGVELIKGGRR
ncbi:ERV/ALR sulfhydryl oxidase domain-containing protein [Melanogaster broomeanus]|nr:ERV/ALR sulfhydryl oxidase domain-containing protein [Melanogaster broomeanus]